MSAGAPRVLVVEDEALIAILLERQLLDLGYGRVDKSPSGELAVERCLEADYDLVLMDVHLASTMNGIEAAAIIMGREEHPALAFMTAYGDPGTRSAAWALGPLAFLEKPLDDAALGRLLEAVPQEGVP